MLRTETVAEQTVRLEHLAFGSRALKVPSLDFSAEGHDYTLFHHTKWG